MSDDQKIEIELLKKDVAMITNLCEKFDTTIDKMQEIAVNLSRMVSLQEQRLENQERISKEVQNTLEMRRIEHNNDIKELHSRITTTNRDLTEKIEETEKKILDELHAIRQEMKHEKTSFVERLGKVEMWKYTVIGAVIVMTWILARADIGALGKLLFR